MQARNSSKALENRRKATSCANLKGYAQSQADRDQLSRMRDSWLTLAANEEWLGGLPPSPPGNCAALASRHA
jgi:hypothetical protein